MIGYEWRPIEDLPDDWRETLASSELAGLFGVWKERVVELKDSPAYQEFMARLCREWAIETGIIEGLYDIDRGVTRTLIEHGLNASLIAHGDANKPASKIIPMLKDHEMVVEGLFDFVGQQRQLSTSYIKQVHQALTTHQETAEGRDQQGHITEIPLLRGDWKKWPNNPTRPDGKVHEYCPPEQVASEMDCLIAMHEQHILDDVPPEVEAAWLHHRFTQIHPFQDGNGRVARALASLVFIRAGWFPFVVRRGEERDQYIESLEQADYGDLSQLIGVVGRMQKKAFNQAIDVSQNVLLPDDTVERLITEGGKQLKQKELLKRKESKELLQRAFQFDKVAEALEGITAKRVQDIVTLFNVVGKREGIEDKINALVEIRDEADMDQWGYSIRTKSVSIRIFLDGVSSFHIARCSAFLSWPDSTTQSLDIDDFECAISENLDSVTTRFKRWLEDALVLGIAAWRKSL